MPPPEGWASHVRDLLKSNPSLPLVVLAVAALLACATSDAGYYPTVWYPGALFVLGLLAVGLLVLRDRIDVSRPSAAAILLLGGFAVWSYLSILWAEDQAIAWDGANRVAFYTAALALVSLWRLDSRGASLIMGLVGLGLAGIGLVELLRAMSAADPGPWFIDGRLAEPAGYINANVALWSIGIFPCLMLACARRYPALARGVFLGAAGLLGALALLGQSRGWIVAFPLALLVFVLLAPHRVRALVPALVVVAAIATIAGSILAVLDNEDALATAIDDAGRQIVLMSAALVVIGTLLAIADRASAARPRAVAAGRTGVAVVVAVAALAGTTMAVANADRIDERASNAWDEFTSGEARSESGSRFTSGDTNRYDFWVVAVDVFQEHPWRGIGSENFQAEYLRRGSSDEQPRFPHSLWLGVLSQTGIVGFLLFVAALIAAALALARAIRSSRPQVAFAAATAAAVTAYWLLHASLDWFWEFPAVTGLAIALLGAGGALGPRSASPKVGNAALLAALGVLIAAALSFTAPWLSARETDRAARVWPVDPALAYERLDRARSLNPLSARPDLVAGTIAIRRDDLQEAERRFRDALDRQPRTSYAWLQLGAIAAQRGDRADAERLLLLAHRDNPRSPIVNATLRAVRRGRSVEVTELGRRILEDARSRVD